MSIRVSCRSGQDIVAKASPPDYALSSHVAPLGLAFYSASSLLQSYRGGALVGE
jgi:glucose/arabinose dehydrogenase